jgi:hypothetical protein
LEEPIEALEIEVVDLPDQMEVAVFENTNAKNKKEHRVKFNAGERTFYAGKFVDLLGWDNQVRPGRNSGRDNAFYRRFFKGLGGHLDDPFFSHLADEKNRRQPNTLVILYAGDQSVAIITPKGQWVGDLQATKSRHPKAPRLKGTMERE